MGVMIVLIVDDEVVNDYNNDDNDDRNDDFDDDDNDDDDDCFDESSIYLRYWTHHGTIATHSHYQGTFIYIVSDW